MLVDVLRMKEDRLPKNILFCQGCGANKEKLAHEWSRKMLDPVRDNLREIKTSRERG